MRTEDLIRTSCTMYSVRHSGTSRMPASYSYEATNGDRAQRPTARLHRKCFHAAIRSFGPVLLGFVRFREVANLSASSLLPPTRHTNRC